MTVVYTDQLELVRSMKAHVAAGGRVEAYQDDVRMYLGWRSLSGVEWMFQLTFVKQRKITVFGDLIRTSEGRAQVARAFNHKHARLDVAGQEGCKMCVVEDVMTT